MPVYEGIGIGVERAAVVLDLGTAYTKCGFSGESSPRFIIPSKSENLITKKVVDLWSVAQNGLADALVDFIYHIYFRLLSVSPRERRVVICESLVCPSYFRRALAEVLFKHFEAPSILHVPTQQLPLFTLGIQTGLVVDVGWSETTLIPFVEGIPLLGSWEAVPLGAQAIHKNVNSLMREKCMVADAQGVKPLPAVLGELSTEVLEDIMVRVCFVRGPSQSESSASTAEPTSEEPQALPVNYPIDDHTTIIIDGHVRSCAADVMFVDDVDGTCIPRALLNAITKAPVDCRKALAENLIVVGGTSQLPGFRHRLLKELKLWVEKPCFSTQLSVRLFKLHNNPVPANSMAWVGGSVYSATGVLKERSLAKDTYADKGGQLPDWTSCDPDLSAADALSWQKKRSAYAIPVQKSSTSLAVPAATAT